MTLVTRSSQAHGRWATQCRSVTPGPTQTRTTRVYANTYSQVHADKQSQGLYRQHTDTPPLPHATSTAALAAAAAWWWCATNTHELESQAVLALWQCLFRAAALTGWHAVHIDTGYLLTSSVRAAFYILLCGCACVCVCVCGVVQAYAFQGYWEDIGTIDAFYHANLALVGTDGQANFSFYDKDAPIYTMSRFLPPSKVMDGEWTAGPCRAQAQTNSGLYCVAAGRRRSHVAAAVAALQQLQLPLLRLVQHVGLCNMLGSAHLQ